MESYRLYPINLDVISWLGVWHVKNKVGTRRVCLVCCGMQTSEPDYITINQPIKFYEEGAQYFQQASSIQPGEVMMAWNE